MKILAVSDIECRSLTEHLDPRRWADIDLVLACGDLSGEYLSYLTDALRKPLFYVRGNHDSEDVCNRARGCQDVNGRVVEYRGLKIAGLEGCRWYNGEGVQRTERQMAWAASKLRLRLMRAGGADIFISHAPPQLCADAYSACPSPVGDHKPCPYQRREDVQRTTCPEAADEAHRGFRAYRGLIKTYAPQYWVHGHTHLNYGARARFERLGPTEVVDAYESVVLQFPRVDGQASAG